MFKVDGLKQRGNESFRNGNHDEALRFYSEAIEMERSSSTPNNATLAILYSNSAQVYLAGRKYAEALEAANRALELDSTFYKSILRRALANIELGNLKEAEKDARFLVRKEPRNMQVIRAIRRIQKPQRIGSKLQHALIRHSLKRTVARPLSENPFTHYNNMEDAFWRDILLLIQRLAFLSTQSALQIRPFLSDSRVLEVFGEITIVLPGWFCEKHMLYEPGGNQSSLTVSRRTFGSLMQTVKPERLTFLFDDQSFTSGSISAVYRFDEVVFMPVREIESFPHQKLMQCIRNAVNHMTQLPYFKGIEKINSNFPQINSIVQVGNDEISLQFLKLWHERNWPVRKLIFNSYPVLSNFENFNGVISNQLTDLHVALPDFELSDLSTFLYEQQFEMLKLKFPQLCRLTGAYAKYMSVGVPTFTSDKFSTILIQHFLFLTRNFNKKPDWCPRMRIFSEFFIEFERYPGLYKMLRVELENFVRDAQQNFPNVQQISLTGPKTSSFGWSVTGCSFALIEMETEFTDFQVAFNPNYRHEMFY